MPLIVNLFVVSALIIGIITFYSQSVRSARSVTRQAESLADDIAEEVSLAVEEFPARDWLLKYWYEHADELDIEYDVDFSSGSRTQEKCRLLTERQPGLQLRYVDEEDVLALPAEDQKLYAEIAYSWLITHVNEIKHTYSVSYLFCVVTDENYETQFFLFSGADEGAVRGREYEQIYPLGTFVDVSESQREGMREAAGGVGHLSDAGDYVDYYGYLTAIDDKPVLIGLTYDLSNLQENIRTHAIHDTAVAIAYQIALCLVCIGLITAWLLRPLKKVSGSIRLYADTKDSGAIAEDLDSFRAPKEISQLAEDFTGLAREMDDYTHRIESIAAERERLSTELSLAARIQADMLPSELPPFPDRTEFAVCGSMDPARAVGGDFYDFFLVDDDHLCLFIADVSGKGIPAALFMMMSKIILTNNAMLGMSPSQILTETNIGICDHNQEEMFVTVWLGILEISTGRLTAANAGHEYPMLKRPDGSFELFKDSHGFVLGGMDGMKYKEYELLLEPGAKLFLYTDGVPEATNAENELFGTERTLDALNTIPDGSPEQLLGAVLEAVDGFVKEADQFDDLTMLCLEYRGPSPANPEPEGDTK